MINEEKLMNTIRNKFADMSVPERRAYLKKMGFNLQEPPRPTTRPTHRRSKMTAQSPNDDEPNKTRKARVS